MEAKVIWQKNMEFEGKSGKFTIPMDATPPLGHNFGPTPKELVAMALAASTGMDVIGLLKKYKQSVESLEIEARVESTTDGYPVTFKKVELLFKLNGVVDWGIALKAIELSQTTYCGLSSMLSKTVPISWQLYVNGREAGRGISNFDIGEEFNQSTFEG